MPLGRARSSGIYRDRAQAGEVLAGLLASDAHRGDVTVVALPRGGVPVAWPISRSLGAPLEILAVRKLGVPGREELALGAIAWGGVRVLNQAVVSHLEIDRSTIDAVTKAAQAQLAGQQERFGSLGPRAPLLGRRVVLVDDGLATGSTMEAAIVACRRRGAGAIVVAAPVGAPATVAHLATLADEVVCPETPVDFLAVGLAYRDFTPVSDAEVVSLLSTAGDRG